METATATRAPANQVSVPLESVIGWTWRDRIGHVWHRVRAVVEEMNYAARRLGELQMRLPE
jgi:hypothetical protein